MVSVILFGITTLLTISIIETISPYDFFTNKKYYESETHRKKIEKDLNNLIQSMQKNRTQNNSDTYIDTTSDSKAKVYCKNVPDELKQVNYTYFFAEHYSFYHDNINISFRSEDYNQYREFYDFSNKFYNNNFLLYEDSTSYDAEPDFILSLTWITDNRNTYVVRHKNISSYGNYINNKINFNDLSDKNKELNNILVILSYSDEYLLNTDKNWQSLIVSANITVIISMLTLFYIILYIIARCRYHINGNSYKYLKRTPKFWDLTIIVTPIIAVKFYLIQPLLALVPSIIFILYLCYALPSLLYAIKYKTLFNSTFVVKTINFIKSNKNKIYLAIKKLSFLKKPFICFIDIITGRRFNIKGASTVEKFIFRYLILFVTIICAAFIVYISWYDIILIDTDILIILFLFLLLFIFYHYHAQKLLSYFDIIEKQIEKMYSGCYQIDTDACRGTAFERDIDMLAQIGTIFEKNMEDKIKMERTKVELVTNVSHDLKTPLTSIISYIDLLSHDESLSQEARDYVNILAKKSDRLKHIVNDVFELAMTTSGEIKVNNVILNLNKLIIQTTTDLEDKFNDAGMEVRIKLADTDIFISSDGDRLYRIIQNLIDNALKFSLKGTRIYIQETVSNGMATVKITNTANYEMDFTKEDVMERFFRGDKSRNSEGNGLGLSIAQGFTIACGGTFDIDINGDQFNAMMTFPIISEKVTEELRKAVNNA